MSSGVFTVFARGRKKRLPAAPGALEQRAWRKIGNIDWRRHAEEWDGKTALVARASGGGKERR